MRTEPIKERSCCLLTSTAVVSGAAAIASAVALGLFFNKLDTKVLGALAGTTAAGTALSITTVIILCKQGKGVEEPTAHGPQPDDIGSPPVDDPEPQPEDEDLFYDALTKEEAEEKRAEEERAKAEAEKTEALAAAAWKAEIDPIIGEARTLALNLVNVYFEPVEVKSIAIDDETLDQAATIGAINKAFSKIEKTLSAPKYRSMIKEITDLLLILPHKLLEYDPTHFAVRNVLYFSEDTKGMLTWYDASPKGLHEGGVAAFDEMKARGFDEEALEPGKRISALLSPMMSQYCRYQSNFQKALAPKLGTLKGNGCKSIATLQLANQKFRAS